MEISGWILTIILMLVIPFALATIGGIKNRNGIGGIDTGIFLTSIAIMIIYLIYVGTLESFTLIFAIIIMGFAFFGGKGGEQ
jgi:hypothetical protein